MTDPSAAVILAGGAGSRLGGADKPALRLGNRSLLEIALAAVAGAEIVVVGPPRELPAGVRCVVEDPPGGGPAAALVAGMAALPELPGDALIAVLAADLPGITRGTVDGLCRALAGAWTPDPDPVPAAGAVLVDAEGRRQYLTGVWRRSALMSACGARQAWSGVALRTLLASIAVLEVPGSASETADVDTPGDWRGWQQHR